MDPRWQKKLIAELEQKLALNQQQVQAALAILGEANIAPDQPPEQLAALIKLSTDLSEASAQYKSWNL